MATDPPYGIETAQEPRFRAVWLDRFWRIEGLGRRAAAHELINLADF